MLIYANLSIAEWHISGLKQSFYFAYDSVGQESGKSQTGQFSRPCGVSWGLGPRFTSKNVSQKSGHLAPAWYVLTSPSLSFFSPSSSYPPEFSYGFHCISLSIRQATQQQQQQHSIFSFIVVPFLQSGSFISSFNQFD